jgi:hypothetical protein
LLLPKVRLFALLGRRVVDRLTRTRNARNDCFLIAKRDTTLKLLGFSSPGNSDFFSQNQPTLGVKHFFDYWYNDGLAFLTHRWHFENLAADGNCLNFRLLTDKTFVDESVPRSGLLAHSQAPGFGGLLSNLKLLREEGQLRTFNLIRRRVLRFGIGRNLSPSVGWLAHDGSSEALQLLSTKNLS